MSQSLPFAKRSIFHVKSDTWYVRLQLCNDGNIPGILLVIAHSKVTSLLDSIRNVTGFLIRRCWKFTNSSILWHHKSMPSPEIIFVVGYVAGIIKLHLIVDCLVLQRNSLRFQIYTVLTCNLVWVVCNKIFSRYIFLYSIINKLMFANQVRYLECLSHIHA